MTTSCALRTAGVAALALAALPLALPRAESQQFRSLSPTRNARPATGANPLPPQSLPVFGSGRIGNPALLGAGASVRSPGASLPASSRAAPAIGGRSTFGNQFAPGGPFASGNPFAGAPATSGSAGYPGVIGYLGLGGFPRYGGYPGPYGYPGGFGGYPGFTGGPGFGAYPGAFGGYPVGAGFAGLNPGLPGFGGFGGQPVGIGFAGR